MKYIDILKENIVEDENIFNVAAVNMPFVEDKIAELNKKAAKLGCPPIILTIISKEMKCVGKNKQNEDVFVEFIKVKVTGSSPKIAGYELIASIDHTQDHGVMVNVVPGKIIPPEYRNATTDCDHCHTSRIRNNTYVLRNTATNEFIKVGKSCLKDFLGHQDPKAIVGMAALYLSLRSAMDDSENYESGGGRQPSRITLTTYMAYVIGSIKKYGWVSKQNADDYHTPTAYEAISQMYPFKEEYRTVHPTEDEFKQAETVIQWVKEYTTKETLTDYEHNMKNLFSGETFDQKYAGFVASACQWFTKTQEKELERKAFQQKAQTESNYVGTIGEKAVAKVLILAKKYIDSAYGVSILHVMKDENGNQILWFSSGNDSFEKGKEYDVKFTVSKHEIYNGVKQTYIKRMSLVK